MAPKELFISATRRVDAVSRGLGVAAIMFIGGVTSFVLALVARLSGALAIVGLITGIFAVGFSLLPALYLLLSLLLG